MTDFITTSGNLLEADVDALVNTVNTVGVMGKGIALQFKKAFPANYKAYEKACKSDSLNLGSMFVFDNGQLVSPRLIINFPTKGHWRSKSKLNDIERGLDDLAATIRERDIRSIALPPLGCGNGGLDWAVVEPLIRERLADLPTTIQIFSPSGAPAASSMLDATSRPDLTPGKAALVAMIDRYTRVALEASVIEVQKLMYFLQEAGQPLKLRYEANRYGPYADNLRHVLIRLEGHHLEGFGDGSRKVRNADPIAVLPGAAAEAESAIGLFNDPDLVVRINRTIDLAEGFESAYGMELLATVHWCATHNEGIDDAQAAAGCVREWSNRKERLFTDEHIAAAWDQLQEGGWLTRSTDEAVAQKA